MDCQLYRSTALVCRLHHPRLSHCSRRWTFNSMAQCNFSRIRISPQRPRVLHHEIRGVPAAVPTKLAWVPSREVECHFLLLGGVVLLFDVPVSLFWCSVFGFRISPSRFPGLGPTQGSWPVRVSCVETCAQFAFHHKHFSSSIINNHILLLNFPVVVVL